MGPGPGNPVNGPSDIGIIASLFDNSCVVPILGICLGFQVMCNVHGAEIEQLDEIRHGQVFDVDVVDERSVYQGFPKSFKSVRYHSLHVLNNESNELIKTLSTTTDGNKSIVMGGLIKEKPWYGVQYHPESCCSELGGQLISNFMKLAKKFNLNHGRRIDPAIEQEESSRHFLNKLAHKIDREPIIEESESPSPEGHKTSTHVSVESIDITDCPSVTLKICDSLQKKDVPFFLMASSSINPNRGEFSIIALPNESSEVFTHYTQLNKTTVHNWRPEELTVDVYSEVLHTGKANELVKVISENKTDFWTTIGNYMKDKICSTQYPELPFIGGFVGILGYEMGQYTHSSADETLRPDAKLCFVNNTILIHHTKGKLYTVGFNTKFPTTVKELIGTSLSQDKVLDWPSELPVDVSYDITLPTKEKYKESFQVSQKYLHQGDSYEICLTTQTKITPSETVKPWRIFQTLVQRNPAPFSSFFQFDDIELNKFDLCLISTSPERFLKYTENSCELRPIKGTVRKGPHMDIEKATAILKTPKEFGENLMILDLIRNDLYELLPKVTVDEMMTVEEYETVYQLVSVVSGHCLNTSKYTGLDVLKHSLPPGSMTGAPKKKTVELLQDKIEPIFGSSTRGVYSGVTGYWSANLNGDWSVNIRCMYSYDQGTSWQIGAGGAITVLSTCEGEWEEMFTKLESALQIFNGPTPSH